ncbi:MAG: amidohydrolase family protein [Novosphingobium sp.]
MINKLRRAARHALAACLALACPAAASADTLVDNVNGITIGSDGALQRFTGIVIGNDGRISQVLQQKDKRPKKVDYRIEGQGRIMLPGIVAADMRLMDFGLSLLNATASGDSALPPPRPEDWDVALQKAQRQLAARGITAVTDTATSIEHWQAYRRAGDARTLYLRIAAYATDIASMVLIGGPGPSPWLYDDRLRLNGVHLVADGTLETHGAALKAPYADRPDTSGKLIQGETQLRNLMSRAAIDGFQVSVAAHGDAAVVEVLGAIDELALTYKGERRWRIDGLQLAAQTDLPRLAAHGAIVSFRPGNLAAEAAVADARLGPGRIGSVQPWQSLDQARVKFAIAGSRQSLPSPFADLAAAISREDAQGQPSGGWQPQQRIGREAVLAALTANAAFAAHGEGRFGRIVAGERADFILVDRDPMTATPAELRTTRVLETWIGGVKIYQEGLETEQKYTKEMPGW